MKQGSECHAYPAYCILDHVVMLATFTTLNECMISRRMPLFARHATRRMTLTVAWLGPLFLFRLALSSIVTFVVIF